MAVAMAALLVIYAGWQIFRWPGGDRTIVGDAFFYPVGVAAIWAALAAARRSREHPRLRSAWRLLALGSAIYLGGDIAQTVYELQGQLPYPSVADALYLLFYPVMLWGLLRVPAYHGNLAERVRLGLDLAVVAIGGTGIVMYVVLGPTVIQGGPDALQTAISVAYPVGDMVLLVGLASVLLRRTAKSSSRAFQFMAAGLVLFVAADLVYGYINLHSTYQGGDPVDSLWMIAIALFAVAGAAQTAPVPVIDVADGYNRRRASWAPYIAVASGYGLLLINERHDHLLPDGYIVLTAVLLATLVSVRQFLAQRDLLQIQGQLSHQSLHDSLTGLPNRALVIDRAEQMLARAGRVQAPVAALYIDIDGFKRVNDSFGHAAGDELLRTVAERLSESLRQGDTVARLGGDEFVVLMESYFPDSDPELVAQRICEAVARPSALRSANGRTLSVSASVGIAVGLHVSAEELLRDADFALYEAKHAGKNRWMKFESTVHAVAQDRIDLAADLEQALAEAQFFLLYQPLFALRSETLIGVEALIRWRHPVRGVVSPDAFIPLAEETGMIVAIGRWVLQTACQRAADWHRQGHTIGMSVNVSATQLDDDRLFGDVAQALTTTGLDPATLTLEITETALMRDASAAARRLTRLKELGVRIAVDDFGTGHSSLAYLRQFPVDALKIDRSFVSEADGSRESMALIETFIRLGQALGLETVAEGIEQRPQLRHLQDEKCDSGQGFLLGRPLAAVAIDDLLRARARVSTVRSPALTPGVSDRPQATPGEGAIATGDRSGA